jgi:transcriptional regulator with XRE-family HTH domain
MRPRAKIDPFVGGLLLCVMEQKKLTRAETARRVGTSRSSLTGIITGRIGPSERTAIRLGYVLGVEANEILYRLADSRLVREYVRERKRITELCGKLVKPSRRRVAVCHADVLALCRMGSQHCHLCRDWDCGDNMNPDSPRGRGGR